MELILKEDVQNLGFKDDLVNVKNGYGRNYLIPQGLAKTAEALKSLELKISAKTGAGDKLFGSVGSIDLAAALEKEGHAIDKKYISILGGTIKRTGASNAQIRLHRDVIVDFSFEVVGTK